MTGAMTIAEGDFRFKTDVSLVFNNPNNPRKNVLRTSLDSMGVWKSKYVGTNMSPFQGKLKNVLKDSAIIDNEVWVFDVNATSVNDLVTAIQIAINWYKVSAIDLLGNIYVKNLNAERENEMGMDALVKANKALYSDVTKTLFEVARKLNVTGSLNFYILSSSVNRKIPQKELHGALKDAGAEQVETDIRRFKYWSGKNDASASRELPTNLHLATLKL